MSTQEQAESGYSISEQSDRITKYCEAKGWELCRTYIDGGYSGAKLSRPALQEMIRDCKKYDMILVYKLDRLSRSQKDTLYLIEDVFKSQGVEFASMQENFDTSTPLGMAMVGILSVFAQLEREQIKERMQMGKVGKVKEGHWIVSTPPIGYEYVKKSEAGDGKLVVNEEEAEQVREIYDMFLSGMSLRKIGFWMDEHHPGHSYTHPSFIKRVLQNPVYYGVVQWKGEQYAGRHEAIISEDTFIMAQDAFRRRERRNIGKSTHLLTGIAYCGSCGARMYYTDKGDGYHYYRCGSQIRRISQHTKMKVPCFNKGIRAEKAEKAVLDELLKLKLSDVKEPKPIDNTKAIQAIDRQIERTLQLYTIGDIEIDRVKHMVEDLQDRKRRLEEESARRTPVDGARRGLMELRDVFTDLDDKARIQAVRALVERVNVTGDDLEIILTFETYGHIYPRLE